MIAVCDHNSARNVAAVMRAAEGAATEVIPGLEVTTLEEIHIVTLFPTVESAYRMQEEVYARLTGRNDEGVFGCQVVVDEFDQVEDLDERLLIGASTIPVARLVRMTHELEGLAIASHVDRPGYGIFGQLGFIPDDLELDALEVSYRSDYGRILAEHKEASRYPLITSSDAHYPEDIGRAYTTARMASATFSELRMALAGAEGRALVGRSVSSTS
jgi:PHP family Zn ribbon phosphoesterase